MVLTKFSELLDGGEIFGIEPLKIAIITIMRAFGLYLAGDEETRFRI